MYFIGEDYCKVSQGHHHHHCHDYHHHSWVEIVLIGELHNSPNCQHLSLAVLIASTF